MPTAVVIGAGLSGLTAAHRLGRAGWSVEVLDAEPEVGGRTRTSFRDGFVIDTGASALAASYTAYLELADEVGLREEVVEASPWVGIMRDGRVHLMAMDRIARSGLTTRLLSWPAKLRALRLAPDLVRARRAGQLDYGDMRKAAPLDTETARAYALRALGPEVHAYLCEPVVRTMLIADTDAISKVELFSGMSNIFSARIQALLGGQGRLARCLAEGLDVTVGAPVEEIRDDAGQVEVAFRHDGERHRRRYDAAVVATPLPAAVTICPDRHHVLAPLAATLDYTQAITVAIGTRTRPASPAMLIQYPSGEDAEIALTFLEHNKAPDRAPAGRGLFGLDWEAGASARWMDAPDEAVVDRSLATLRRTFPELSDEPLFASVTRWTRALPRTAVGAYRAIGAFTASLDPADHIQFASDYMSAAGQNTAVVFGNRAASNLLAHHDRERA